ncbi:MAG TPA: sugar ABC transporter permease [Chloroflexia bacterium]|nr:sugar ABC transporter permease [Chloroflexia bacterium]
MSNVVTPQAPARPSAKSEPAPMVVAARGARRRITRDRMTAMLMLLPSVLAIVLFVYGFIAWNAWASLTSWRGLGLMPQVGPVRFPAGDYTGLSNYGKLFSDQRFLKDLTNNAFFTVAFLIACTVVGLMLAIFLDRQVKGETFFRNVFLFPMALSFVVTGTIWRWIFLDLKWITDKDTALIAVIIAAVWQMTGFTMAMFLAALRGIPDELREAARVDGATEVGIYRHVVLPLINPIILSALIILGHISLKIFDLVYVMTSGSPTLGYATDMPSIYMFQLAFKDDLFARSAAISMIMLIFVAVVIVPYLWSNYRAEKEAEA